MYSASKEKLTELVQLLYQQKAQEIYTMPVSILSNGTIGQHIRHIIELYTCLIEGYNKQYVSYDNRKRDIAIETNPRIALETIHFIIQQLDKPDKAIEIHADLNDGNTSIQSSYSRELLYNLEHCIHHQALIRAALISMQYEIVSEHFGVAPSTIKYRKQCAQ